MSALLWQPPQLSGIGHRDAIWNAILTHARTQMPLSGNVYAVFDPIEAPDEQAICTHLKMGAAPKATELFIIWRHFPFEAMMQASLSVEDLSALPPILRDALVEGMTNLITQSALQDVIENGTPELTIFSTEPLHAMKERLPADIAWFDMNIENVAQEPIAMRIGCARRQLIALAASRAIMPLAIQETAKTSISIPCTYTLGSATFMPRQLASLTEGAVIVLPTLPQEQLLLRVEKTVWEFHANGGAWILAGQRKRTQQSRRQRRKEQEVTDQGPQDETKSAFADDENKLADAPAQLQSPEDAHLLATDDLTLDETPDAPSSLDAPEAEQDHMFAEEHVSEPELEPVSVSGSGIEAEAEPESAVVTTSPLATTSPSLDTLPAVDWVEDSLVREGVRISDLGITVDFDIGERDFTLAELETWQPGALVALDPPALQDRVEVTLRANGRTIATGDLIAIDDRLAVRLSKLLLRA